MNYKNLKESWPTLLLKTTVFLSVIFVCGCASFATKYKTEVLVSRDLTWVIPKGESFTAIQLPKYKEPTKFVADEDLVIIYKGTLLELEKEANRQAFKQAKVSKKQMGIMGIIGSVLAIGAGFLKWKSKK